MVILSAELCERIVGSDDNTFNVYGFHGMTKEGWAKIGEYTVHCSSRVKISIELEVELNACNDLDDIHVAIGRVNTVVI